MTLCKQCGQLEICPVHETWSSQYHPFDPMSDDREKGMQWMDRAIIAENKIIEKDAEIKDLKERLYWHKVFILLMARCGASYRLCNDFIRYMADGDDGQKEFRFQGDFGFGGKCYSSRQRTYVSCYPEDLTTEILISIDQVNKEIEALKEIRK